MIAIYIAGVMTAVLSAIFHGEMFHLSDVLLGIIAGALIDIRMKLNKMTKP
ncbi:hypothetical protein PAESOLCIP111_04322 [Paenibacillus solanacearum]|uniref:Uncharacterized protein n=1 Tax=Paenibacillus solanacearum TaxID=2048548 RepID=A0A916K5E1_9BACL|nr:hypothetical protein [Paenibacillus solanacearum]CAG7642296.1 hypothetical protein PAESOLCIP111_04322 [Paenibacillus solanacearum]